MSRVVIHRDRPRWLEIRGRRYEPVQGADHVREGWGYTVFCPDGSEIDESFARLDDIRRWAQEWEEHPEWGYPEGDGSGTSALGHSGADRDALAV